MNNYLMNWDDHNPPHFHVRYGSQKAVININTGETVAFVKFEDAVQEIFAVNILPARFPEMLEWGDKLLATSYVVPDEALADVPQAIKEK